MAFDHRGTEITAVLVLLAAGMGIAVGLSSHWKSWLVVPVGLAIPFACWYLMLGVFWLLERGRNRAK